MRRNASFVKDIVAKGGLLQINKTSLSEKNGLDCYDFAMWMLHNEYVTFVASDAHDIEYRTTNMQYSFMKIYNELSKKYAENLFFNNPDAAISGKKINTRWELF